MEEREFAEQVRILLQGFANAVHKGYVIMAYDHANNKVVAAHYDGSISVEFYINAGPASRMFRTEPAEGALIDMPAPRIMPGRN